MSEYTEGPWRTEQCSGGFELKTGASGWIFKLYDGRQESESDEYFISIQDANASLIAAAPELLEALKAIIDDDGSGIYLFTKARAAIVKAEGR